MTSKPTMRDWLAGLDESELATVIDISPLASAGSRLRSVEELAERLSHPANVARVLQEVPLPILQIVEAASALGAAASVRALGELLGGPAVSAEARNDSIARWIFAAQQAALVWLDGERLRINPGLDSLLLEPLGIGRPARVLLGGSRTSDDLAALLKARNVVPPTGKSARLAAALALFADLPTLRKAAAAAPPDVLETLTAQVTQRLATARCVTPSMLTGEEFTADEDTDDDTSGYRGGAFDREAYLRELASGKWARSAALAVGRDWGYAESSEMPSEVYLALAPAAFRAPFDPDPVHIALAPVARVEVNRGASAALADFVATAMAVFESVARDGLAALKRGGVGTRELSRIGKQIGVEVATVRLALELGLDLNLFAYREDGRVGVSPNFDTWRRQPPHQQAVDLVSRWMLLEYVPTAEHDFAGAALPAMGRDDLRIGLPCGLILTSAITSVTEGDSEGSEQTFGIVSRDQMIAHVAWRHPTIPATGTVFSHSWAEARLLGVVADGAVTPFARALVREDLPAAAALAETMLPAHSSTALFGSDLTVLVAGNPAPDVVDLLTIVADREAHGAANTWRVSEASVRSALDAGYAATDLAAELRAVADGALPQTWEYLLSDTARKHGRMRVTSAGSVITCDDEALLAEAVASRKLRALGMALVAPTVASSGKPVDETLRRLREAGFLPTEVGADGAPVVALRRPPRAASAADRPVEPHANNVIPLPVARLPNAPRTRQPRSADRSESAADIAARLLSAHPDSNPLPGEVADIADVERMIARYNRRLSGSEVHELADAETRLRPVTIRYRSQSGSESVRTLSRLNLVGDSLFAYCHLREADRIFRLDRIIEVSPAMP